MICAKFGWNWSIGSGYQNVESLRQQWQQQQRQQWQRQQRQQRTISIRNYIHLFISRMLYVSILIDF